MGQWATYPYNFLRPITLLNPFLSLTHKTNEVKKSRKNKATTRQTSILNFLIPFLLSKTHEP
ncbi:hypothetical protein KSS87_002118 [Heliosperma pusillum]|nr:hypothetical protein KSS87_020396 [Heliosperma pusillum]KAH9617413.1 hypothetical protein KSS87_002118 [Heliosperma pusillum]